METIELEDLRTLLEEERPVRVVMTLGERRYAQAHIPGTETFGSPEDAFASLSPHDRIVVYCTGGSCPSSRWAYRLLRSRGYERVQVFTGGLTEWDAAGLPLVEEGAA